MHTIRSFGPRSNLCSALIVHQGASWSLRYAGDGHTSASSPALPAIIGRYRIIQLLSEGGMGVVYEAEQQSVAPQGGSQGRQTRLSGARDAPAVEQESQVLGRLQHPGIAQIYEAGTADNGFGPEPYFAIELVRGESLLEYADLQQLNVRQRLELMARVCKAIHHAHQRGHSP
jgi:non-specific serine/threonine protein kinase/serine/threonine-protein kinase